MKLDNNKTLIFFWGFLIFALSLLFYYYLVIYNGIKTDIQPHADAAGIMFSTRAEKPANFLYFLIVYVFSGFSTDQMSLLISSIIILSLAISMKFVVSYKMFYEDNLQNKLRVDQKVLVGFVFLLLLIISPIPWSNPFKELYFFYKGKITPTVWHNSTTIFLIPFALLLFMQSYKTLFKNNTTNLLVTSLLVLINIAIKPSFFFVYAVVFPLFLIWKEKFSKRFFIYMIPVFIGGLFIIIEFIIIYKLNNNILKESSEKAVASGITIAPFEIWANTISPKLIPLSLVTSLLLPVAYYAFNYKELFEKKTLYFISFFVISIAFFVLLIETGPRRLHGNFFWQTVICSYLLFLNVVSSILKKYFNGDYLQVKKKKELIFLTFIFLLHLFSGIIWIFRIFYFKSYY